MQTVDEPATLVISGSSLTHTRRASGELKAHASLAGDPEAVLGRLGRGGAAALHVVVLVRDATGAEVATAELEWRATLPLSLSNGAPRLVA